MQECAQPVAMVLERLDMLSCGRVGDGDVVGVDVGVFVPVVDIVTVVVDDDVMLTVRLSVLDPEPVIDLVALTVVLDVADIEVDAV